MSTKKKITKSLARFTKESARKNLVAPPRTMSAAAPKFGQSAATTPTSATVTDVATDDTSARIEEHDRETTKAAAEAFAALPQPSYSRGEQSTAPWISPTDALANLAASPALEAQMRAATAPMDPRVVAHEHARNAIATAMVTAAFGPRTNR